MTPALSSEAMICRDSSMTHLESYQSIGIELEHRDVSSVDAAAVGHVLHDPVDHLEPQATPAPADHGAGENASRALGGIKGLAVVEQHEASVANPTVKRCRAHHEPGRLRHRRRSEPPHVNAGIGTEAISMLEDVAAGLVERTLQQAPNMGVEVSQIGAAPEPGGKLGREFRDARERDPSPFAD